MAPTIETLGELRHACTACGGSCQGNHVRLVSEEEEARVQEQGAILGIADPVDDQKLRFENGQCVFLGEDKLCRIHARWGLKAKPLVCQQYPLIAVKVDDKVRVGLDPGCYTHISSYKAGPYLEDIAVMPITVPFDDDQRPYEEGLLDLCSYEGMTLARLLQPLTGEAPAAEGGLPPGFARRWVERVRAADVGALLSPPDTARQLRFALGPIAAAAREWDPAAPPPWPALAPETEAYAIDVVRRMIYLRLARKIPSVAGVALLTIGGAIAAAWTHSAPQPFGITLAGWVRALRAPVFWQALTPDAATMAWLARGPEAGA